MSVLIFRLLFLLVFGRALLCMDAAAVVVPVAEHPNPANCMESERMALLDFKKHMKDPNNKLSSWVGRDCCLWEGVHCDNTSGNIIGLALGRKGSDYFFLGEGKISPSLLQLQHLNYLDLSGNYFNGTSIPSFISQFKELRYLNISGAGFEGPVPASFGNLSSLQTLDLSYNDGVYNGDDHQWLSHLTSLQHLDLSGVNLSSSMSSNNLFLALNRLPSINELHLSGCELEQLPLSIPHLNFSSLSVLDLSENYINFSEISWVFNIKSLQYLDFSDNQLDHLPIPLSPRELSIYKSARQRSEMSIPESIGSLCSLQTLDLTRVNIGKRLVEFGGVFSSCLKDSLTHLYLSRTRLKGDIPDWIEEMKYLKVLDLSQNSLSGSVPPSLARLSFLEELLLNSNQLTGTLPKEIGNLAELVYLDLSDNQLSGIISEEHFSRLEKLEALDMSGNSLVFKVSSNWVPLFLLKELRISSCSVGSKFPTWLRTQHKLSALGMSQSEISSTVPDWFWNATTLNLVDLDLSYNQIQGMIPKFLSFTRMEYLDLSSNLFSGPLPNLRMHSPMLRYIDFSNNSFSGPIPQIMLNHTLYFEVHVSISMNKLNGSVPDWLCQMKKGIAGIDISNNHLSGELPNCWLESSALSHINLANNNISGGIPDSICHLPHLSSLLLSGNKLSGELPNSLKKCNLFALDLSHNNFTGSIPTWLGEHMPSLIILMLKQNSFINHIPQGISQLQLLQILDLSGNNLSGPIPSRLSNMIAMRVIPDTLFSAPIAIQSRENVLLSFRGREDEYGGYYVEYVSYIDLSNNELSGNIPEELASLYGLESLNLSGNNLEGVIPDILGRMNQLQSLDLSRNKLSGSIPATLSNLTFLSLFNVSYNNLSGRIPSGNQFNTFIDPSIYIGNHLCGFPLSDNCTNDGGIIKENPNAEQHEMDDDDDDDDILWLYIGSLSGFPVGFWIVWGVLALKKKWRHAYFHCIDNNFDKVCVYVAEKFAKMTMANHY